MSCSLAQTYGAYNMRHILLAHETAESHLGFIGYCMLLFQVLKIKQEKRGSNVIKKGISLFLKLKWENGSKDSAAVASKFQKNLNWDCFKLVVGLEIINFSGKGKCKHCCVACTLWPVTLGRNIEHSGLGNGMLWLAGQFQNLFFKRYLVIPNNVSFT